jgi:shikimate kinase
VLVGLPGAGKSTTGRRLAKILGVPFADSDQLVEASAGREVREIFVIDGESEFRRLESAAILAALADFDGVLALGGGALALEATRAAIAAVGAPVVLLRTQLDTLVERVGTGRTRPLLAADPPARLAALAGERELLYRSFATLTVDTDGRTPGQIAAQIAARLHERARQ